MEYVGNIEGMNRCHYDYLFVITLSLICYYQPVLFQVRVIELESLLEKERVRLAELRRKHYNLAGESEGWEVDEVSGK